MKKRDGSEGFSASFLRFEARIDNGSGMMAETEYFFVSEEFLAGGIFTSDGTIDKSFDDSWEESKIAFRSSLGDVQSSSSLAVLELDGGFGMMVECVFGTEAGVGWIESWLEF